MAGCSGQTGERADEAADDGSVAREATGLPETVALHALPSDVDLSGLEGTPVIAALAWLFDALAADAPPAEEHLGEVFSPEFLRQVPAGELRQVMTRMQGSPRLTALDESTPTSLVGEVAQGAGQRLRLVLGVTEDEPTRIDTLLFQPPLADPEEFADWEAAEDALAGLAADTSFLAAEVEDGCRPLTAQDADVRRPVASLFKLYVLGAIADAVDAGTIDWDDTVEVEERLRSLPSGRLQDQPSGTEVTVAEAAELMIAISDNTATDLLIDRVGRRAVEDAQADYGHDAPDVNRPFLTTREMFQLKWQVDDETRAAFVDADTDDRRELVDALAETPLDVDPREITAPVTPERIEWFASPSELCAALVALGERTEAPGMEPLGEAMAANPIVRLGDDWTSVAAKGGSEPGVLAFAWLLDRADGQRMAFVVTLLDEEGIDEQTAVPVVEGALELLAGQS